MKKSFNIQYIGVIAICAVSIVINLAYLVYSAVQASPTLPATGTLVCSVVVLLAFLFSGGKSRNNN